MVVSAENVPVLEVSEAACAELGDRDLAQRVRAFLASRHIPELRQLKVEAADGTVVLRGRVSSYYAKQLCHDCCRRVAGVRRYVDAIDVERGR